MTRNEFLALIDEVLERDAGTLTGAETLEDEGWDSLSVLSFIAMAEEKLGYNVPPAALVKCRTVDDLVALAGDRIS